MTTYPVDAKASIIIKGDKKVLYEFSADFATREPVPFEINVYGVEELTIQINDTAYKKPYPSICLVDLMISA